MWRIAKKKYPMLVILPYQPRVPFHQHPKASFLASKFMLILHPSGVWQKAYSIKVAFILCTSLVEYDSASETKQQLLRQTL